MDNQVNITDAEIVEETIKNEFVLNDDADYSDILQQADIHEISEKNLVNIHGDALSELAEKSLKVQRLFRAIVTCVGPNDLPNKIYAFPVSQYQKLYGMKDYPKKQLDEASDFLTERKKFHHGSKASDDNYTKTGFLSFFDVHDGVVTFGIAPRLLPYYKKIKEKQQYMIGFTKDFESSYSYTLYEHFIIKLAENKDPENENSISIYMTLNELRQLFNLTTEYVNSKTGAFSYGGFNSRVLKPIYADINRKRDGKPVCNINFEYKPTKAGRMVVGITFDVVKVILEDVKEPVMNPFYEAQSPDVKLGYDLLLQLNIKKSEIERCILTYKDERFLQIVKYINTKKHKGRTYISACMRNGWIDNNDYGFNDFLNIAKAYNMQEGEKEEFDNIEAFIISQPETNKKVIYKSIMTELQNEPQIYKYLSNLTLEEIIKTKDVKMFFIEKFRDLTQSDLKNPAVKLYNNYEPEQSFADRKVMVNVFNHYGISKTRWAELLAFSDEHIKANIDYCVKNYQNKKQQENIAGLIISAITDDYAHYAINKREAELQAKKEEESRLTVEAIAKLTDQELNEEFNKKGLNIELVLEEQQKRENRRILQEAKAENAAFEEWLSSISEEQREAFKRDVIKSDKFGVQYTRNKLKGAVLDTLPLEELRSIDLFNVACRTVWKEQMQENKQ